MRLRTLIHWARRWGTDRGPGTGDTLDLGPRPDLDGAHRRNRWPDTEGLDQACAAAIAALRGGR